MISFQDQIAYDPQLQEILQPYRAYLVGGAVRDALLGLSIRDLDFCLPERTLDAARRTADRLGGAFFILDQDREAGRVILTGHDGLRQRIDFTTFQGKDLESDLAARDFTITAMAVPLEEPGRLIDPLGGLEDLRLNLIRACSDQSLLDDPVRSLRAVRMAADFGFRIEGQTRGHIRQAAPGLQDVSPERLRDELFRIVGSSRPAAAVRALNVLGLARVLFSPREEIPESILQVMKKLTLFWTVLAEEYDEAAGASWVSGLMVKNLGRYREQLQEHLREEVVWERSLKDLLMFGLLAPGALSVDPPERLLTEFGRQFRLSSQEVQRLKSVREAAERFEETGRFPDRPTALEIHRFFRTFGGAGIEGVFLALGESLAGRAPGAMDQHWPDQLARARAFLKAWWEAHDLVISPPQWIDGHALMEELDIEPGPVIGEILTAVVEAQVEGKVESRSQALAWAARLLEESR